MRSIHQEMVVSRGNRRRWISSAKQAHVREFTASGQPMSAYCRAHSLPLSSFSKWVRQTDTHQLAGFKPVTLSGPSAAGLSPVPVPASATNSLRMIELQRGDVVVRLPMAANLSEVLHLVRGILSCD